MLVTIKMCKITGKVCKLLEIRPLYTTASNRFSHSAPADRDLFKFYSEDVGSLADDFRPLEGRDYDRFISKRAAKRQPALTRQITALSYKVGKHMLSLAEGMPNEQVFPFSRLAVELRAGGRFELEGGELATALQYVPSQGLPQLISALRQYQQELHRPPALPSERDVLVTNGAQHGIYQCFELLVEPRDPVLMAEYTYNGAHIALKPYDPEILGIPEDQDGLIPEALESVLADRIERGLRMPRVLYTIPTGNNPTGVVISEDRRRRIYELACQYDFLIVEDDPYMFLNYTGRSVPSFLSLDRCGRVLRLDSLSKVVSAGLRAGWVTAPAPLVARLELHMQAELLHSCTLTQVFLHRLLSDRAALASHLSAARAFYRRRRDALHGALLAGALDGSARWALPDAGLFLWLRVNAVSDVYHMVFHTAFERGLMLIPGQAFLYDNSAPCRHVRLTFSRLPVESMPAAAAHLAAAIRHEQRRAAPALQRQATEL